MLISTAAVAAVLFVGFVLGFLIAARYCSTCGAYAEPTPPDPIIMWPTRPSYEAPAWQPDQHHSIMRDGGLMLVDDGWVPDPSRPLRPKKSNNLTATEIDARLKEPRALPGDGILSALVEQEFRLLTAPSSRRPVV